MSDDQGELHDLRTTVEELARRLGAGFREDLAQIRAIAAALAERDVTDDVRALRAEVAALTQRDDTQPVLAELTSVRGQLERLATRDDVGGLRAELAPVQATLDRLAARLDDDSGRAEVLARFQAIEAKLDAGDGGGNAVAERLEQVARTLEQRLDGMATADQVGRLAGDLRAHLADALGSLDGDAIVAELATMRSQLGGSRGTVVEQLQDHLADVASGEVVGALWDEVRAVREAVDRLGGPTGATPEAGDADVGEVLESLATLRSEVEGISAGLAATVEPSADPAVGALRVDVAALADEIRALSDAVASLERSTFEATMPVPTEDPEADAPAEAGDDVLVQVAEELANLRAELAHGLVVEPSDALSASLDGLRAELDGLRVTLVEQPQQTAPDTTAADVLATVHDELAGLRTGLAEILGRLDGGTDGAPALTGTDRDVDVLADQIAALRDLVASEVDGLRQALLTGAERRQAEAPAAPEPVPAPALGPVALDDRTLEVLRDEIRAAGAIGDQVIDALREELKALRRRIAVKAAERVLDDDQLAQIADAVATRIAKG